jgi:hypothetical protein
MPPGYPTQCRTCHDGDIEWLEIRCGKCGVWRWVQAFSRYADGGYSLCGVCEHTRSARYERTWRRRHGRRRAARGAALKEYMWVERRKRQKEKVYEEAGS